MRVPAMKFRKHSLAAIVALALAGMSLSGCVVYPNSYGYGYGGGYYAPVYVAPPPVYGGVVIGGGWGWGHGWRR